MRAHEKALVGLVALTLMLSGCSGPKPEQTVKEFFEAFRLADTARMESLLIFRDGVEFDLDSDMGSAEVTPEQIDVVRRLFSRTAYKIGQVTSLEDGASVSVALTCVDMTEVLKDLVGELFGALMMSTATGTEPDQQEIVGMVMDALAEIADDLNVKMISADITFILEKHDDRWLIVFDQATSNDLMKALFGDLTELLLSIGSDQT